MPPGKPSPDEYESGGATGNVHQQMLRRSTGTARKKMGDSPSKLVKKVRVAWYVAAIDLWSDSQS